MATYIEIADTIQEPTKIRFVINTTEDYIVVGFDLDPTNNTVTFDPSTPLRTRQGYLAYKEYNGNKAWFDQSHLAALNFDFTDATKFVTSVLTYRANLVASETPDLAFIYMYPTEGRTNNQILDDATIISSFLTSNPPVATEPEKCLILSSFMMIATMVMPDYFLTIIENFRDNVYLTTRDGFIDKLRVQLPATVTSLSSFHLFYHVLCLFGIPAKGFTANTIVQTMGKRFEVLCETIGCGSIKSYSGSTYSSLSALGLSLDIRTRLIGLNTAYLLSLDTAQSIVLEQVKSQCKLLLGWGMMTPVKIMNEFYMSDSSGVWALSSVAQQADDFKKAFDKLEQDFGRGLMPYVRMLGRNDDDWNASKYPDLMYCAMASTNLTQSQSTYTAKCTTVTSKQTLDKLLSTSLDTDATTDPIVIKMLQIRGLKQKQVFDPLSMLKQLIQQAQPTQQTPVATIQPVIPPQQQPPPPPAPPPAQVAGPVTQIGLPGLLQFIPK